MPKWWTSLYLEPALEGSPGSPIVDRRIASAFCVLVAITTTAAVLALVWFGSSGNLEATPGVPGRYDSVWGLFAAPALLVLTGLFGALSLTSTRVYARPDELSPDARRSLEKHRTAERRLLIGFGILVAFIQLLVVLSTAGLDLPLELGVRTTFFVFGALFAGAGNMIPKIPFFSRWWQINRTVYTSVSRFTGFALTIAGMSICLIAVIAPLESFRESVAIVLGSAVGSILANALFRAYTTGRKAA